MTVTVRPAHPGELAAIGDLVAEAYLGDGFVGEDDGYVHHLRDTASRARDAELYVAELVERPGEIAGTVTYCRQGSPWCEVAQPGEGEFRMLAVAPWARRRGVAAALVGACVERSTELGCTAVVLCSLPAQQAAHRVYERIGFRRVPDLDWSPQAGVDLLGFRLELEPAAVS